jgi:serine/threonine-protein kinase RsbW
MSKFFFSLPSNELSLRVADDIFGVVINSLDIDHIEKHRLKVIVSELFVNAYVHGNKRDPEKYIDVVFEVNVDEFVAVVKDRGDGVPGDKFKSRHRAALDPFPENGRGFQLTHNLSDKVDSYKDSEGRFCVRIARKLGDMKNKNGLIGLKT